jgi:hypothetical protein
MYRRVRPFLVDLDRDGDKDLVVIMGRSLVWVESMGSGFLAPVVVFQSPTDDINAEAVGFKDVDSDGDDDIVFSMHTADIMVLQVGIGPCVP